MTISFIRETNDFKNRLKIAENELMLVCNENDKNKLVIFPYISNNVRMKCINSDENSVLTYEDFINDE